MGTRIRLARAADSPAAAAVVRTVYEEYGFTRDEAGYHADLLYRRHGARVVGERVHDDPDSSHEWCLIVSL